MGKVTLLLALCLLIGYASSTTVHAKGRMKCTYPGPWCYFIKLMEFDNFENHDVLDTVGIRCTHNHIEPYELNGVVHGDGPWNNFYELGFVLTHNCTRGDYIRKLTKQLKDESINQSTINLDWSVRIYNSGLLVKQWD
uniref:Intein C-terminal splicing domain-containing protein n=1 Tax=Caenorhabditis tropicalis TaxID=1561998 RepID=A0A1I7TZ20_9PELO